MIDTTGFQFAKPIHKDGREKLSKYGWKKRSAEVRAANEHRCAVRGCSRPATGTDHKRKRSLGRDDRFKNLRPLCAIHHAMKDGGQKVKLSKLKWSRK